jgi:hypothetical protein
MITVIIENLYQKIFVTIIQFELRIVLVYLQFGVSFFVKRFLASK